MSKKNTKNKPILVTSQTKSQSISRTKKTEQKRGKRNIWKILGIVSIPYQIASTYGANVLTNVSPLWGYILFLSSTLFVVGVWVWGLENWLLGKHHSVGLIRIISVCFVALFLIIFSTSYVGIFVKPQSSLEMGPFVDGSTQVLVHYGRRPNDWMLTQTTVWELINKPRAALNVNGQDILYIHTDGKELYVDAILFGGYKNKSVVNKPLARTEDFSIQMDNYINTDAGPNKNLVRESQGGFIGDSETSAKWNAAILAQPVLIKNNVFINKPDGWKRYQTSTALEITNENKMPVFVLEYKSPYEITVSGLFITSFGILKVDNSKDVIFQFGSNLSDLGTYTVDRVLLPPTIFGLLRSERTYNLYEIYGGGV